MNYPQSNIELEQPQQLVDWRAVCGASLIAGAIHLLVMGFVVPAFTGGNIWVILRLLSSIVMGAGILAPPAAFDAMALTAGLCVHFTLSFVFTAVLACVTHRW